MKIIGSWWSGRILKRKPLLKNHLATFLSFQNEEKAYVSDVVGSRLIEISKSEHAILELINGRRTIGDIVELLYEENPNQHHDIRSVERDVLDFFKRLYKEDVLS